MMNRSSENEKEERKVNRNVPEYCAYIIQISKTDAWPLFTAMSDLDDDLLRDVKPAGKASSASVSK